MGRPKMEIDWKKVEDLLIAGCSGAEIAGYLGCHPNTIYEKCFEEKGINFTEYSCGFYAKGDSILRAHQFAKALGKITEGDNTLLIWLGKIRLKQERSEKEFESNLRKDELNILPPKDDIIQIENENMILKAKIAKLEAQLNDHE